MTTALVEQGKSALQVSTNDWLMPMQNIQQAKVRRDAMVEFVKEIMIDGTDFGTIPGTNGKPTLLKPGAEKLKTFFGLSNRFEAMQTVEDWTGKDHDGEPFFYYHQRCILSRNGEHVAEAEGSANSWEKKHRWRYVLEHELPPELDKSQLQVTEQSVEEFQFAVDKAETTGKYGKPESYWNGFREAIQDGTAEKIQKETRSGKRYPAWRITTRKYRIPNPDVADLPNTLLKMAQKRALVAACLVGVGASEFFTQDLEDMEVSAQYTVVNGRQVHTDTGEILNDTADLPDEVPFQNENGDAPVPLPTTVAGDANKRKQLHAVGRDCYDGVASNGWDGIRAEWSEKIGVESANEWTLEQADKAIARMQDMIDETVTDTRQVAEGHDVDASSLEWFATEAGVDLNKYDAKGYALLDRLPRAQLQAIAQAILADAEEAVPEKVEA